MSRITPIVIAIAILLSIAGCGEQTRMGSSLTEGNSSEELRLTVASIAPGMTLEEVEQLLRVKGIPFAGSASWHLYGFDLSPQAPVYLEAEFETDWEKMEADHVFVARFRKWR